MALVVFGAGTIGAETPAAKAASAAEAAVQEHVRAYGARDLAALVDGYADNAVILMQPEPVVGKAAIRKLFEKVVAEAPIGGVIDYTSCVGETCLMIYSATGIRSGADTFTVRDGKIVMQSIHMVME